MYAGVTQYFKVEIASPKSSKSSISFDATPDILEGLKLENEDGLIHSLTFSMKEGFTNMDKVSIGMVVNMWGGTMQRSEHLFMGTIAELSPEFMESGEVFLTVTCKGNEGSALGRIAKDLVYPSMNHPKSWGKSNTSYGDIIVNLGKDAGFEVLDDDVLVNNDRYVSFQNPVRQKNKTDWAFMQYLAGMISCTLWVERVGNKDRLFLKDNSALVSKLASKTLYYLARTHRSDFIDIPVNSTKHIQMNTVTVTLESKKGAITQKVNPDTGKTEIVANVSKKNEDGTEDDTATEKWVLDEAKVRGLPDDQRRSLIEMFIEGKVSWEGEDGEISAKPYFKLVTNDASSRTSQSNNLEVEVSNEDNPIVSDNGVTTTNGTKENTGSKQYKTVIDKQKTESLSSKERSALMGRIARREMLPSDSQYYSVVDITPKPEKDEAPTKTPEPKGADALAKKAKKGKGAKKKTEDKRDAGFKIECTVYGTFDIKPKKSYVLEGLGKYSDAYYLYRVIHVWGNKGWELTLTFVK